MSPPVLHHQKTFLLFLYLFASNCQPKTIKKYLKNVKIREKKIERKKTSKYANGKSYISSSKFLEIFLGFSGSNWVWYNFSRGVDFKEIYRRVLNSLPYFAKN